MSSAAIIEQIWKLSEPLLQAEGYELVEVEFSPRGKQWVLTLYIDKPGGVTLDDCQHISYQVGSLFDVEDIITHPYVLEVSSPGIDRPLRKREDFRRFAGQEAQITTHYPLEQRRNFRGILLGMEGEEIILQDKQGTRFHIPYLAVKKARLRGKI
ncbi:MAG: ribosome maturation factor RimP [Nitrospinota bacterium]|nr:MAG: ribosome maturation factor RimP [Nitrospinota bacterium]